MEGSHTESDTVRFEACIIILFWCISCLNHFSVMTCMQWSPSHLRLSLVEQWSVIVSASEDTSVRVWTLEGHFIGESRH